MSLLVPIALFGWIPAVILLFAIMPAKSATAYAFAIGWCFLPVAGYSLPGLPDYTKTFATSVGTLIALALFHSNLFLCFRPNWLDLPALVLCVCPFFSSLSNGLGAYDGVSEALKHIFAWGIPYLIGRIVYRNAADLGPLCNAIIVCGLIYVPLCLWEVKMSPQLHGQIYGFHQHSFGQSVRGGGWRPTVFMAHGLQVALWMAGCLVLALSQWWVGGVRRFASVPMWTVVTALCVTFILLKSTGAFFLVFLATCSIIAAMKMKSRIPLLIFPTLVSGYLFLRVTDQYTGRGLVELTRNYVSEERAGSLEYRLDNENLLLKKAWQQPVFGWGGWGRSRVYDEVGRDLTVTDGLWIIEFGTHGLLGLISLYSLQILGGTSFMSKLDLRTEHTRDLEFGNVIGLCVICGMAAMDSLPNAMVIPVFTMALGAVVSANVSWRKKSSNRYIETTLVDAGHQPTLKSGQLFAGNMEWR